MGSFSHQYGVPIKVFRLPIVLSNCALTPKSTVDNGEKITCTLNVTDQRTNNATRCAQNQSVKLPREGIRQ